MPELTPLSQLVAGAAARLARRELGEAEARLLAAMGFNASWIRQHYGPSLLDPVAPNRRRLFSAGAQRRAFDE